jgi:predicted dehydrogenase
VTEGIGVAVIGAGMAGRFHAHAYRTAQTDFGTGAPPVRLVAIADVNADFATCTAQRYGFERAEPSWQAVAEADDLDAVSIVVANHLHREYFTYPARAFLDEVAGLHRLPTPATFADGLRNLVVQHAVVEAATAGTAVEVRP